MSDYEATTVDVGGTSVAVIRGGTGRPLLMLHDELGFPGWMRWNRELSVEHEFLIPLQPGFGVTPRVEWARSYNDIASFYSRMVRELEVGPIDVIGFSAGGFIAAEMAASCPHLFRRMVLVAPMGVKPAEGEIFDFLATTIRKHIALTVTRHDIDEVSSMYGGADSIGSEQFQLFEAARAETSRLGWEPFMFDPSLPSRLRGLGDLDTLLVWGDADPIVPRSCIDIYAEAIPRSTVQIIGDVGHRPEVEDAAAFVKAASAFLSD